MTGYLARAAISQKRDRYGVRRWLSTTVFAKSLGSDRRADRSWVVRVVPVVCAQDGGRWTVASMEPDPGGNGRRQRDDGIRLWEARFKPQSMTATQVREALQPCRLGAGEG